MANEIEKSKPHILIDIIEYFPNSVVIKTIIRKTSGNISLVAIDTGEGVIDNLSPFFIHRQKTCDNHAVIREKF